MLQRSTWSGLVLSAAVSATCLTGSVFAQDATTAPSAAMGGDAAASPAQQAPSLKQLADDFMHYSLVNNDDLAKANGQALLNANASPQDFLAAFEDSANGRNPRDIMLRDQNRPDLKDIASQLLDRLEEGYRSVSRDPVRIRADIERLANGPRAYDNAREHLRAAGQFAAPLFIEYLQNDSKKNIQPYLVRVMGEIGRPLVLPLLPALNSTQQDLKVTLVKIIGDTGYPQALPKLREIQADPNTSGELKTAVDQAISSIDKSGAAANAAPASLYLTAANNYYERKPSYQPLLPDEKTNPVWVWDKNLNNVQPLAVPTVIWTDVMALRSAESTLRLDSNNPEAISLWLAAEMRRELQLPQGATDPTHDASKPPAAFYARAFGPVYVNPVLTRALDAHDTALAMQAINALEATGGISGLVSNAGNAPLVRALNSPDRDIRFNAAFALARANPNTEFPSYFRVVPVLAEALNASQPGVILVVNPDEDARNKLADSLRNNNPPFTVFAAGTLAAAIDEAKGAPAPVAIVVANGPEVGAVENATHTSPQLGQTQVVITATAAQASPHKAENGQPAVVDAGASAADVVGAIANATGMGDPAKYEATSLDILGVLAADHKSIYNINDAVPALIGTLKNKDAALATHGAQVLGQLNNPEAQKALANSALASETTGQLKASLLNSLAESAKHTGNTLDAAQVNSLIKEVQTEQDPATRLAAATALGALNVPSNQASNLILEQSK
ncbi:MAG: HEAT repeat domain-containing protein [Phycisphaerae bacterium]